MKTLTSTGWPDLNVSGHLLRQEYAIALGELHRILLYSLATPSI